jgi:hypothetical protein
VSRPSGNGLSADSPDERADLCGHAECAQSTFQTTRGSIVMEHSGPRNSLPCKCLNSLTTWRWPEYCFRCVDY